MSYLTKLWVLTIAILFCGGVRSQRTDGCNRCPGDNEEYVSSMPCPPAYCNSSYTDYYCDGNSPPGCTCIENYLRDDFGVCILNENCPPPTRFCRSGCACKKGFLRDNNDECIPKDQCPPPCGENEERAGCKPCQEDSCSTPWDPNRICPDICELNACVCKDGYVRDDSGNCIPEDQCPPMVCGDNEEASTCIPCQEETCTIPEVTCDECHRGCVCAENYVRDHNGTCIPEDECPACGENEESADCEPCQEDSCSTPWNPNQVCPLVCEPNACVCKDGFVRDDDGNCIPEDQCPPMVCGDNEEASTCIPCQEETCSYLEVTCDECHRGCVCAENYVRDDNGTCIPEDECPACGKNEESADCEPCQEDSCSTPWNPNQVCPLVCEPNACVCKDGFVRDDCGNCIPEDQCPPMVCGDNEEASTCIPCQEETCSNPEITCDECHRGCVCTENYVRDDNGTCIPEDECPACGENEESADCKPCQEDSCSTPWDPNQVCTLECQPDACVCKDGFVRDDDGNCIPEDQCPPMVCGDNEEASTCIPCQEETCSNPEITCDECHRGCVCTENYVRDDNGTCIPEDECPACGENEESADCKPCQEDSCSTPWDPNQVCPLVCEPNACVCKDGFVRDDCGNCIPEDQCPPMVCGDNEEASTCIPCQEETCSNPEITCDECHRGCVCTENYVRDDNGTCIPEDECPACGENEESADCKPCQEDSCSTPWDPNQVCTLECQPDACVCKDGFVRDDDGNCIPEDQCPPMVCGDNEEASTCIPCQEETCSNPEITCDECHRGCVCTENYVRDDNGTCIPEDECPACGENEESADCKPCQEDSCSTPWDPNQVCTLECQPDACVCKDGFVRDDDGNCIPEDQCPPMVCVDNEEASTCIPCQEETCSNPEITCDECHRGCVCEENYVRDDNGMCIPEDECPVQCPENEEPCEEADCSSESTCENGCACIENYTRDCQGVCVSKDECEDNGCNKCLCEQYVDNLPCPPAYCPPPCGDNEEPTDCVPCQEDSCDPQPPRRCDKMCRPGCVCKDNFVRNIQGICIAKEQCPPPCKENEERTLCKPCQEESCKPWDPYLACVLWCQSGCICKGNLVRDDDGNCIPEDQCPPMDCGDNEEESTCIPCQEQTCTNPEITCDACHRGCVCTENYVRDDNGTCIPEDECPVQCPENEEPCEEADCSQDSTCQNGCACIENYTRDCQGVCVYKDECQENACEE